MVATSMSAIVAVVIVSVLAIAIITIVAIITRVRVRQSLSHSKEGNGNNGQEADKLEHVGGVSVFDCADGKRICSFWLDGELYIPM